MRAVVWFDGFAAGRIAHLTCVVPRFAGDRELYVPSAPSRMHGRDPVQAVHVLRFVGAFMHQTDLREPAVALEIPRVVAVKDHAMQAG